MSMAVGYSDQYWDLRRYMIVGVSGANHPYPSFWTMFNDATWAQYTGMAWLVAGFATRVIDLKLGMQAPTGDLPTLAYRFDTLQIVTNQIPQINSYSLQLVPPEVPWPITASDFNTWLIAFSKQPPTWNGTPPSSAQQISAQSILLDSFSVDQRGNLQATRNQSPTEGVQHIASNGVDGALCGCKGHAEPDWPHMQPLKRSMDYCPECLSRRIMCHNDYMRGWGRAQQQRDTQYRANIHPGDQTPMPLRHEGTPMPVLWEEEQLSQAAPVN